MRDVLRWREGGGLGAGVAIVVCVEAVFDFCDGVLVQSRVESRVLAPTSSIIPESGRKRGPKEDAGSCRGQLWTSHF